MFLAKWMILKRARIFLAWRSLFNGYLMLDISF